MLVQYSLFPLFFIWARTRQKMCVCYPSSSLGFLLFLIFLFFVIKKEEEMWYKVSKQKPAKTHISYLIQSFFRLSQYFLLFLFYFISVCVHREKKRQTRIRAGGITIFKRELAVEGHRVHLNMSLPLHQIGVIHSTTRRRKRWCQLCTLSRPRIRKR